jgi:hypothetical protein
VPSKSVRLDRNARAWVGKVDAIVSDPVLNGRSREPSRAQHAQKSRLEPALRSARYACARVDEVSEQRCSAAASTTGPAKPPTELSHRHQPPTQRVVERHLEDVRVDTTGEVDQRPRCSRHRDPFDRLHICGGQGPGTMHLEPAYTPLSTGDAQLDTTRCEPREEP